MAVHECEICGMQCDCDGEDMQNPQPDDCVHLGRDCDDEYSDCDDEYSDNPTDGLGDEEPSK